MIVMKFFCSALCVIGVTMIIASCQQEPDTVLDDANPNPAVPTRLQRYVLVDSTLPPGSDTTYKINFTYDSQHRLQKAKYIDYYFYWPDIDEGTTEYFYSGNDSLPYKFVDTWSDVGNTYRDTVFFSYTNGLVSRDSAIEYRITTNEFWGTAVVYYTKSGNNTIIENRTYNLPGITPPDRQWSGTLFQTHLNGNIISQDDTATINRVNFDRAHCTASYDDKKNPFYELSIRYPVLGRTVSSQKNNSLEEKSWDDPSTIESHIFSSYTYRPDGYPLTAMISQPSGFIAKGLYFYNQ